MPVNERRFWSKVDSSHGSDSCWNWLGCRSQDGYGSFQIDGLAKRAHRMAFVYRYGPITDGLCVCHRCDNPVCCNPLHLWAGTTAQNMADKRSKGRQAMGETHGTKTHPESIKRGAAHGRSKLTTEKVISIRQSAAAGATYKEIGSQWGVDSTAVGLIVRRKNWRHVA